MGVVWAQSSSALPAWGGDGPTSSPGLGIGSTAKKALLDLLGGVRGWPPQAAGDDPHGAGDQGQPDVQAFGSARAHHPGHQQGQGSGVPHGAGSGQWGRWCWAEAAMEPLAGPAGDMTAVLAAMEPVDFRVVWEVDLLAIPEVVVSRAVIFLEEVRVVPVEGFLIILEVAVFRLVIFLVVGLEVHLAVPQMVMEEGFLAVFMEEAVNFLDGLNGVPLAFSRAPWLRIEQRGQVALLKAVPESIGGELIAQRRADSISIIFKVLKTYQPGSLAERSSLLKQLVDQRIPSGIGEWLSSLRTWRRWLVRVTELRIQPPDPVLLLATLDKFAVVLGKISAQVSFRLQIARAALRVDVAPSPHGILQFADTLQAEGETVYHGGGASTKEAVKAKTMEVKHCYAQELLQRNGVVARATHIKVPEEKEDPAPALRTVREAQRLTGELLWLSGKTRPDLAAAVQRMSSRATRNPEWVLELGANVLAYLSTSWEKKLVYTKEVPVDADPTMFRRTPREAGTLEVLVDASFGVEEQHSVTGIILLSRAAQRSGSRRSSLWLLYLRRRRS